jgi:aryl-alcohol dehydrogenase-like predicted oxidoreductase
MSWQFSKGNGDANRARWDVACSVEEVVRHLHALVLAKQVVYIGVSDTPAWVVVKANECKWQC